MVAKKKLVEEAVLTHKPRITTTKNMMADPADLIEDVNEFIEGLDVESIETSSRMAGVHKIQALRNQQELEESAEVVDNPLKEGDLVIIRTNATFKSHIGNKWYQFVKNQPTPVPPNVREVLEEAGKLR